VHGDVDLADLGVAELVADGGQGVVFRLARPVGVLLKLYHNDVDVLADELGRLIELPAGLGSPDRSLIAAMTAWPFARVFHRGRCAGLLMREAPDRFATVLAGRSRLLELQFLLYPRRAMWDELVLPTDAERRWLAVRYLRLFQVLHRHDVLVGDVSMRNLLWTLEDGPGVFAIDCDGFRVAGRWPAVAPVDTAGWADPSAPAGEVTPDTDRYKLALLTLRLLLGDHAVTPEDVRSSPSLRASFGPVLTALAAQAGRPGMRPAADSWLGALTGRRPSRNAGLVQREYAAEGHAPDEVGSPTNGAEPRG
jgi:DNA-binding helix-hairpin-helix protein with protein kinase domain